jgi:predicted amidohydrolase
MRIGWVQTEPQFGAAAENLAHAGEQIARAEADLWVLPELFSTGYLFGSRSELARLAEPIPGPTTRGLIELASRHGCALVAGIAESAADGGLYNAAVAVDPTGLRGLYRKIHLFGHEKEWFDPGDLGFPVLSLAGARVGLMICFDWRFPEAARTLALAGATILAHPSNLVMPHCQAAMTTRAIENRVFTITANRIGVEERGGLRLRFTGGSEIVSPDGTVMSLGSSDEAGISVVEIDPRIAEIKSINEHNDLVADRRPDFYRLG